MRFASLLARMPDLAPHLRAGWESAAALDVVGITADSRQVRHGMIFAALPGTN